MPLTLLALAPFLAPLLACPAAPQAPAPAEMKRFDRMVGNWTGAGTVRMAPGEAVFEWKARATAARILDGHCVQEDVVVDLGSTSPVPLVFRTIYFWEPHAERFVSYSMDNTGLVETGTVEWAPGGRMLTVSERKEDGKVLVDQWTAAYAQNAYSMRGLRSENGGEFYTHLEGSFERGGEGVSAGEWTATRALDPVQAPMRKLSPQLGTWKLSGRMRPGSGQPMVEIGGREIIEPILGGHVHRTRVLGDPVPGATSAHYGEIYVGWSASERGYLLLAVSNSGEASVARGLLEGRRLVYTGSPLAAGAAHARRNIVEFGEDGRSMTLVGHALAGAAEPEVVFEGTLVKSDG